MTEKKQPIHVLVRIVLIVLFAALTAEYARYSNIENEHIRILEKCFAQNGSVTDNESVSKNKTDFKIVASTVSQYLPMIHLLRHPFDAEMSARAWTNYLAILDYERMYFLDEDIKSFEPHTLTIADEMREGNLDFPRQVFSILRKRISERYDYVEKHINDTIDFTIPETMVYRRKNAPWPTTTAEQDELWRKRLKNEFLSRKITDERAAIATNLNGSVSGEAGSAATTQTNTAATISADATSSATSTGTNSIAAARPTPPPPSPEEVILKRYHQHKMMMDDSDDEFIMSRFFDAVTTSFDPHTNYMSPDSEEDFEINMQLSLQGIGAQLRYEDGAAKIEEIIPGGPASRDTRDIRLVKGDKIIGVGQGDEEVVDTLHWPLQKTVRLIRGPKGTKVVLLVQSASDPSGATTRYVDIIRDEVKLEDQAATSAVETYKDESGTEHKFGYIYLPTFYLGQNPQSRERRSASSDIAKLLTELNNDNVEGLVFDLRGNGGGALAEAIDTVGLFIRTGPVVLVKDRTKVSHLYDRDPAVAFRKPMVVLIDRASASASEIVAGALQDYGRAIIVGDSRTFGKGTVQQVIDLAPAGTPGSLKVTNASFFRINGGSTQAKGVESDIFLPSYYEYLSDIGEDKMPNAIAWSEIPPADYVKIAEQSINLPEIKARSERRRENNPKWIKYLEQIKRVKEINDRNDIPLDIDTRREMARDDSDVSNTEDLPENWSTYADDDEKAKRRANDNVLREALAILYDNIELNGPVTVKQNNVESSMDLYNRFFR